MKRERPPLSVEKESSVIAIYTVNLNHASANARAISTALSKAIWMVKSLATAFMGVMSVVLTKISMTMNLTSTNSLKVP